MVFVNVDVVVVGCWLLVVVAKKEVSCCYKYTPRLPLSLELSLG